MNALSTARDAVLRHFVNIKEIDEHVVRGEKRHGEKCYAVAYVDLADDIIERANHLGEFQERVMGDDFFNAPEQLRWNNYLYIVAGPKSIAQEGFAEAKVRIEADKEYARKRVVSEGELEEIFGDSKLFNIDNLAPAKDVIGEWSQRLTSGGLDLLLEQPTPRTEAIERITSKTATRGLSLPKQRRPNSVDEQLQYSYLQSIEVERFRPVHDGKTYSFGTVTLIVGPNGAGKTSLLESIEYLYCGHNRRDGNSGRQSVKGMCRNTRTQQSFSLESTTESGRIKARCLAWYRRDERFAKSIVDGFTRYNFLDTDAAFRLSTDLQPGEISDDLSRLLIGSEASALWEYLGKIASDLSTAYSRTNDQLKSEHDRKAFLDADVKRLQNQPSLGKSLSVTYRVTLSSIGWRAKPPTSISASPDERHSLDSAVQALTILLASNPSGASTRRGIEKRVAEVDRVFKTVEPLERQRVELDRSIKTLQSNAIALSEAVAIADEWIRYCTVNYGKALSTKERAKIDDDKARAKLGLLPAIGIPTDMADFAHIPLDEAVAKSRAVVSAADESISTLEAAAKNFGRLEAAQAEAAQQLKVAALAVLQHQHSDRECPVCGTDHDARELLSKIESISARSTTSTELQRVNETLVATRKTLLIEKRRLHDFEIYRQIAQQLGLSTSTTIGEIANHLRATYQQAKDATAALSAAEDVLSSLANNGLSERGYLSIRSRIGRVFPKEMNTDDVDVSITLRNEKESSRQSTESRIIQLRAQLESIENIIADMIKELDSPDWPLPSSLSPDFRLLCELKDGSARLAEQVKYLSTQIRIDLDARFEDIRQSVLGAINALDQALHALASDANTSTALSKAENDYEESKKRAARLAEVSRNQKSALDVLETLIRESSLENATRGALDSIAVQINDVFGRIHTPREDEYRGHDDHMLQTRTSQEPRTLEQVSTGQRAAFALSIFLALNLTAQSAPPLLLIDDPIAHIDDLNALSFMDYLRELAIHGRRQIFFATADSRIAALFEKKFAFLGETGFRTIRLERRFDTH